jgi:choline dehydrogenase-like flavoprotein
MDHPTQLSWARTKEPVWPFRGPLSTAGIESTRAARWRDAHAAFRIQLSNRGWDWPKATPNSTVEELARAGLRGKAFEQALADLSSRELGLAAMAEQLPSRDNRIVPDFEQRDALGIPRPRITFKIDDYTRQAFARSRKITEEICARVGVTELHHGDALFSAGHLMGTYRMGTDPKQSVVNPDQRAHDHPNLFLLGSGVFPTGAASNPTLTIAALALKAVDPIRTAAKS